MARKPEPNETPDTLEAQLAQLRADMSRMAETLASGLAACLQVRETPAPE